MVGGVGVRLGAAALAVTGPVGWGTVGTVVAGAAAASVVSNQFDAVVAATSSKEVLGSVPRPDLPSNVSYGDDSYGIEGNVDPGDPFGSPAGALSFAKDIYNGSFLNDEEFRNAVLNEVEKVKRALVADGVPIVWRRNGRRNGVRVQFR